MYQTFFVQMHKVKIKIYEENPVKKTTEKSEKVTLKKK